MVGVCIWKENLLLFTNVRRNMVDEVLDPISFHPLFDSGKRRVLSTDPCGEIFPGGEVREDLLAQVDTCSFVDCEAQLVGI